MEKNDNKNEIKESIIRKRFNGVVISDKMDKTIVVKVEKIKKDSKYGKRVVTSKKYKVHDPKNQYKEDDKVIFEECRPLSKDKKWRVIYS